MNSTPTSVPSTEKTATGSDSSNTTAEKLLVLDGHSLAFRGFYALPADKFSTSSGQTTNAIYGFVSMLINLLKEEQPTHILCAFDESGPTFRSEAFSEYKAHRPPTPPEFSGQVDSIRRILEAMNITCFSRAHYEADDIIASSVTQASQQNMASYIVTGDRDSLQLVTDNITVLYPKKGTSDMVRYTPSAVEEKYGLTPQQYLDFAALRGDPSDNLPSVPKVGEKTATKWIQEYGSLEELVAHADELTGQVGQSFREHIDQVLNNQQLTRLVTDVSLPFSIDDLQVKNWDVNTLQQIFDELEFSTLRQRLFQLTEHTESADTQVLEDTLTYTVATVEPGRLQAWLQEHATSDQGTQAASLEIIGDTSVAHAKVDAVVIATHNSTVWTGILADLSEEDTVALAAWLENENIVKNVFHSKGIAHALHQSGFTLRGVRMDIELAAYILRPGQRKVTIDDLLLRYAQIRIDASTPENTSSQQALFDTVEDNHTQAQMHAVAINHLTQIFVTELAAIEGTELLNTVELPVSQTLYEMEHAGIAVDSDYLEELGKQFAGAADSAAENAYQHIREPINLNSPKQLQTVLFDELGMPKTKKIKTGYTTDADALVGLYEKTSHPFLQYLLEHRDAQKLKTTVEGLIKSVADDGRIHTTFQQTVTATGRLSSTDPNLQNIPVRTHAGKMIRSAFVVGKDYETLMTADYSQIEMRLMAHLCHDEGLIYAFNAGEDLHSYVGAQTFGVPIEEITPEMRRRVKAMSYGLSYGLSAYGLAQQLKISPREAEEHMSRYFDRFGKVRDYLQHVVTDARNKGYTETMYGRRRYLPDLNSTHRTRREIAERAALNAPIQGSAADLIKIAMINVHRAFITQKLRSRLLLQIHDELIVEVAPGEKEQVTQILTHEMKTADQLAVPLEISCGYGASWNEAEHDN